MSCASAEAGPVSGSSSPTLISGGSCSAGGSCTVSSGGGTLSGDVQAATASSRPRHDAANSTLTRDLTLEQR